MKTTTYLRPATLIAGLAVAAFIAGCNNQTADSGDAVAPPAGSGTDHAAMGHDAHTMGTSGIEALKGLKGKEFDIAYLSQMIAHHRAAIDMAQQALKTASKPEVKQEAQKVVSDQTAEIARMTTWLKLWYSAEPSKAQQALVKEDMKGMMSMPVTNDQMFLEMMVPHHQGAIDMSMLVPERSERAEVKKLAEEIIREQKAEIARYHQLMGHGT